jgi:DNA polymerase-3 subunit beta
VLDRQELAKAIKLASYFAAASSNILRLTLAAGTLTIAANAAEVGETGALLIGL